MTGYMYALGPCYTCGRVFTFNVEWVPSLVVNGDREPICRSCVDKANPERAKRGLPLIEVHPDAYEPGPA